MMTTRKVLRDTKQRRAILEELRGVRSHPTADEIYEMVRRRLPRISLGTVYRNLDILSENGMIQRLEQGAGCYRFDGNAMNHYHVRCINCGRVADVTDCPIDDLEEAVRNRSDYVILSHRVEYLGICRPCQGNPRVA